MIRGEPGGLRRRVAGGLTAAGVWAAGHAWLVLALAALLTGGLGWAAAGLRVDTSTEGFLRPGDPILQEYQAFQRDFGGGAGLLVVAQGPVASPGFLGRLRALEDDLAAALAPSGWRVGGLLDLLPPGFTGGTGAPAALAALARGHPELSGAVLAPDLGLTLLALTPGSATDPKPSPAAREAGLARRVDQVQEVLARHQAPEFRLGLAGSLAISHLVKSAMQADGRRFLGLSLLVAGICLLVLFRRPAGVLLPLVVAGGSVVGALGAMALAGTSLKLPTIILPSFLLAVSLGAAVHLVAALFRQQRAAADRRAAIRAALAETALPILATSLTTAAGLASFSLAEVAPVADLGLFAALGVLYAWAWTLLALPALWAVLPLGRGRDAGGEGGDGLLGRALAAMGGWACGRPKLVLALAGLWLVGGLVGAARIGFTHDPLAWLPAEAPVRQITEALDQRLGGAALVEAVVRPAGEGGRLPPEVLLRLSRTAAALPGRELAGLRVAGVVGPWPLARLAAERLGYPSDPASLAQGLTLAIAGGTPDLAELRPYLAPAGGAFRLSIRVPWVDAVSYGPFLASLQRELAAAAGPGARVALTGLVPLFSRTFTAAISSAAQSYLWAGLVITGCMLLLVGNLRLGLWAMLPNFLPIVLVLGVLGWLGVRLDMYALLVGAIALGLAVDDTMHFLHRFLAARRAGLATRAAVQAALATAGRAMVITSLTLAAGALVYLFSAMNNLFLFGWCTAAVILLALAADVLLTPALLTLLFRER